MKKFLKNQKGITMMEVLVTVGLLAIVIVPCLSAFVMAQRGNAKASQVYYEYTEAQNLMETLKGIQVSEAEKEDRITWANKVKAELDRVGDISDDGISIDYDLVTETVDENEIVLYYTITIYSGEAGPTGDNLILEGVIAP